MDHLTAERRSWLMSRVNSKDTGPELLVRRFLHRAGLRYALHRRDLPGCPDIVLPKWGAVVFVHGCYWHRHQGCSKASTPRSNVTFWQAKFEANVSRDRRNVAELRRLGWRVFTVWACDVSEQKLRRLVRSVKASN